MAGSPVSDSILQAAARAEQFRRRRDLVRHLARVIPAAAGVVLIAAAIVRFSQAPISVFWVVAGMAFAGVAVFAAIQARVPAVTDAAAAKLDDDASLQGELRSAHWFASQPEPAPAERKDAELHAWTDHHLNRAAERTEAVSWPAVYPPVKAARAWAGSTTMMLVAIALVVTDAWPSARGNAAAIDARGGAGSGKGGSAVPTDLQKEIDELLKAVQAGAMPMDLAREKVSAMRDKLAELDPKLQAALAKAAKDQAKNAKGDAAAQDLAARAEQAAASADLPQDMKWSLEDLAAKLAAAGRKPTQSGKPTGPDGESDTNKPSAEAAAAGQQGQQGQQAGAQNTLATAANQQSTQMMVTTAAASEATAKGEQADAEKSKAGQALDLKALRKETIQADEDTNGENVLAEMRRKSEKGKSTLSFTRVPPLANYDPSRATAPPATPDAMRALVKQYFIRK
jgi:hypothetical protein